MQTAERPVDTASVTRLQLSEVIAALTYALDLTEGQPPGHSIRCCWIGSHIGRQLGLDADALWELYYTLLLKDAGCSSNAARLCELYGSDDRSTKRDFKWVDTDKFTDVVRFVLSHTGVGKDLADRFRRFIHLARAGERLATELIQTRCERGADIARQLGFGEAVAVGIYSLDEHWNGRGKPHGLTGNAIPLNAQIALLAQVIDVFHHIGGRVHALGEIRCRRGSWFDPRLIDAAHALEADDDFWAGLGAADIEQCVYRLEPRGRSLLVDDDTLDAIAAAFGQVVDSKSPYTAGHSERVALYTDLIAERLGLDAGRRRWLKRGALLHDLGKLGVSNSILDKAGSLDEEEWAQIRKHPVYTEQILARITPFDELAVVSGAHHERLDGKGYPRAIPAGEIALETRIITVSDIFDAITAARPYRGPIPVPEALEIMGRMVGNALDQDCYAALVECVKDSRIRP
ncbi:HD-GYP domain-containing protein [Thiohalobacter thiocyanaticus]|uniref:HD domain-containing protein n=1 Tax=Thiohalobacter thiocyanaticus TaxID=585455 RepID=A0A426QIK6_9GAMM|nr:HD domain-containing protein [Thiohalobacter thiocyanaticus]RRQ21546.1 HD domain-containing protein [Thiohalobacter thiocyanaticus]